MFRMFFQRFRAVLQHLRFPPGPLWRASVLSSAGVVGGVYVWASCLHAVSHEPNTSPSIEELHKLPMARIFTPQRADLQGLQRGSSLCVSQQSGSPRMFRKSVGQECPRVLPCAARVLYSSVQHDCPRGVSQKSVKQKWRADVLMRSYECPTRKSVLQDCATRASYISEFRARVSDVAQRRTTFSRRGPPQNVRHVLHHFLEEPIQM